MAENGANLLPAIAFFRPQKMRECLMLGQIHQIPSRSDTCREFEIDWVWFLPWYPHVPMMAIARRKPFPQSPYGSMFDQGRLRTSSLGDTGSWSPSLVDMLVTRPSSGFWRFFGGFQGDEQNVDGKRVIELSAFHWFSWTDIEFGLWRVLVFVFFFSESERLSFRAKELSVFTWKVHLKGKSILRNTSESDKLFSNNYFVFAEPEQKSVKRTGQFEKPWTHQVWRESWSLIVCTKGIQLPTSASRAIVRFGHIEGVRPQLEWMEISRCAHIGLHLPGLFNDFNDSLINRFKNLPKWCCSAAPFSLRNFEECCTFFGFSVLSTPSLKGHSRITQ